MRGHRDTTCDYGDVALHHCRRSGEHLFRRVMFRTRRLHCGRSVAKERKKGLGSRLFQQSLDSESVRSFGQMAVCVAASKAATGRPNKVPLYSSSKRPRPSARPLLRKIAFLPEKPRMPSLFAAEVRLASICGICCYTSPCASSAISQYLFYTPNVLQNFE